MKTSYFVICKRTGKAVMEFFTPELKRHINTEKYNIMTAAEYLPTLNRKDK